MFMAAQPLPALPIVTAYNVRDMFHFNRSRCKTPMLSLAQPSPSPSAAPLLHATCTSILPACLFFKTTVHAQFRLSLKPSRFLDIKHAILFP